MNSATQNMQLQGPSGLLEGLCDLPEGGVFQGTVVIAHPHPLFGGTMQNKVVQTWPRPLLKMAGAPFVLIFEVWVQVKAPTTKAAVRLTT